MNKDVTTYKQTLFSLFVLTFTVILFEIALTRIFAVTLFANYAQLVLALGIFGFSFGAIIVYFLKIPEKIKDISKFNSFALTIQAVIYFLVLIIAIKIKIFNEAPHSSFGYQNRLDEFVHGWRNVNFYLLFFSVTVAFTTAGTIICTIFSIYKEKVSTLYGYDLLGAGLGAVLFIPLASNLPSPWIGALCVALCLIIPIIIARNYLSIAIILSIGMLLLYHPELLKVRFAAGLPEATVNYEKWTPTSRITIHKDSRAENREIMVFDSASVSMIVKSEEHKNEIMNEVNRGIVYQLAPKDGKVAILAASAGPEVVVAQTSGFKDITAIDVNGGGFEIITDKYKHEQVNPYRDHNVQTLNADGRAGVLASEDNFTVIQMVHANLWSVAGLLSNAWSPWFLTTSESFQEYLSKLTPDGLLSFSKGFETDIFVPSVIDALEKRGVKNPFEHIVFLRAGSFVLLVRPTPWSDSHLKDLQYVLENNYKRNVKWFIHPKMPNTHHNWNNRWFEVITDNKPFPERSGKFIDIVKRMWSIYVLKDHSRLISDATSFIYLTNALQTLFSILIGIFFIIPFVFLLKVKKGVIGKLSTSIYFSCLGIGFILVQVALIHKLILFIGHPTYTLCVVLGTMLVFSGLGSLAVEKTKITDFSKVKFIFFSALVLLTIYISLSSLPLLLREYLLDANLIIKYLAAILSVGISSFFMGMFFPTGFSVISKTDPKLAMLAWAFNGWFSVLGAVISINLSREYGYESTVWVALISYLIALTVLSRWRARLAC